MKKSILAVAVLIGTSAFAQNMESKNGEAYLPQSGDWAIGIDARPFLNYFGNLIGGGQNANIAPGWNYLTNNQTITGKYFAEDNMAYRASLRIGFGSMSGSAMVADRSVDPVTPSPWPGDASEVENTFKLGSTNIGLAVGMEKRRGFGRLQGFYGAELGFSLASTKETYTYGNALTASTSGVNVDVTAADDMTVGAGGTTMVADVDGQGNAITGRATEFKGGSMFSFGLRAFIGAEYFVLPRLAIGGEFGWGLGFASIGASSTSFEVEGLANGATVETIENRTTEGTKTSMFGVDNDNMNGAFGPAGSLRMTFHF
jgi:hypothetical protein